MRRLDDYIMQTAIVTNPHKEAEDAKQFVEDLLSNRRFMSGEEERPAELDREALDKFKKQLGQSSSGIGTPVVE